MTDVVVTLPKSFGLKKWLDEGDPPGTEWSGQHYYWRLAKARPKIEPGERVYVVHDGRLIGYSPLVGFRWDIHGNVYLVRGGGAVACTIDEHIPGFRGYRYRWWSRDDETLVPSESAITYTCPETGEEVLTDKVVSWKDQWELMFFRHRCPECGQEHELMRPTT